MDFEFTDSIWVQEYDLNKMAKLVKKGLNFYEVFEDIMSGYGDHDYYCSSMIEEKVKEEIMRRIHK